MNPQGESAPQSRQRKQELRIALVMNGGVSLAIWMGGVTRELDRVRRADGAYGELLALTESEARIDVIAGASAGGINGAVLALAIARGGKVDGVRELWMENGDIAPLLRDPRAPHEDDMPSVMPGDDVPSVMQGDAELLSRLSDALLKLGVGGGDATDAAAERPPLHLSITGTIPEGKVTAYRDAFGAIIPDVTHRARFRFRRPGLPPSPADSQWPDDFARFSSGEIGDVPAAQLALAARSSASFPVAFEPSFVPIGAARDEKHPDMEQIADFDSGRWVIDGGVLVNTPIEQALEAISELSAERTVRRILGYVVPDPATPSEIDAKKMPSPLEVITDAMSRLPRVQSVGHELKQIEENNENVRRRRLARERVLGTLNAGSLFAVAKPLFRAYVRGRRTAAAEEIGDLLVEGTGSNPAPTTAQLDELRGSLRELEAAPWLPPLTEAAELEAVPVEPWAWGLAPIENAANLVLQVLHELPSADDVDVDRGERDIESAFDTLLEAVRSRLHEGLAGLTTLKHEHAEFWQETARTLFPDERVRPGRAAAERLAGEWGERFSPQLARLAMTIAEAARECSSLVRRRPLWLRPEPEAAELTRMLSAFEGEQGVDTLRQLLALDVIQRATGAELAGIEQAVELVMISANANSFGRPRKAQEKLAGLQVHHFGAFYKASWRANDWMWGRLDGADRLVLTLLDPLRIQRRVRTAGVGEMLAKIREIACREDGSAEAAWLEQQWSDGDCEESVRQELQALLSEPGAEPQPTALPASYVAIRRRLQLEVVREELPKVAEAVSDDLKAGAGKNSFGCHWQREFFQGGPLDVAQTVLAFERCDVGMEQIKDEVGSRRFFKVSTKGAAVIGALLSNTADHIKLLKPLKLEFATLRKALTTVYRFARLMPPRI
jgi:patatin-related protein